MRLLGQPIGSDLDVITLISKVRYNVVVVQFQESQGSWQDNLAT